MELPVRGRYGFAGNGPVTGFSCYTPTSQQTLHKQKQEQNKTKRIFYLVSVIVSTNQKADDKIFVCKFSKNIKSKLYHIENSKTRGQNSVDLNEVAHNEPPHQDLCSLQIYLFSSVALKRVKAHTSSHTCMHIQLNCTHTVLMRKALFVTRRKVILEFVT